MAAPQVWSNRLQRYITIEDIKPDAEILRRLAVSYDCVVDGLTPEEAFKAGLSRAWAEMLADLGMTPQERCSICECPIERGALASDQNGRGPIYCDGCAGCLDDWEPDDEGPE
jgi:hypothetical protein